MLDEEEAAVTPLKSGSKSRKSTNDFPSNKFAVAGAAAIYGVLVLHRMSADPSLGDILRRLPDKNAVTIHVDLTAIRAASLLRIERR